MLISDPSEFLKDLDSETLEEMQRKFAKVKRFLKSGDTFNFTCDKTGRCCKNRLNEPIILSPYDVLRLREKLKITSREFLRKYGDLTLGSESRLPIVLLKYELESPTKNKCSFLRSYGCKVYKDRPLRCRLYPVGRIHSTNGKSFFFLTDVASYCNLGKGQEHTIEQWIEKSEVEPYFKWSDKLFDLFFKMDHQKYRRLDDTLKYKLGFMIYDFDTAIDALSKGSRFEPPETGDGIMNWIYVGLETFVDKMVGYRKHLHLDSSDTTAGQKKYLD